MIRTSHLPVAELRSKYRITRAAVRAVMYNQFCIPRDFQICMKYMRVTCMSGRQFASFLTGDGELRNNDPALAFLFSNTIPVFTVIYQGCTPYYVKRAARLSLSWRIAQDDFNIEPVVIVRIINDKGNQI